jgi:DNA-binding XRE family transcriptional regulator
VTLTRQFDRRTVQRVRARLKGQGISPPAGGSSKAMIVSCDYGRARDSFVIVYDDLSHVELHRRTLADVGDREVVAWAVDPFRRGVDVLLSDGTVTSFSAEFPRYVHDEAYRDLRRSRTADGDLARRVADRVRRLREQRGWSVTDLARRLGMAPPNVHRVEAGSHTPSPETIVRLAAAFAVPVQRLVRAEPRPGKA